MPTRTIACQCCKNPFGVCHNSYRCACHPQRKPPPSAKPESINEDKIRYLMRNAR